MELPPLPQLAAHIGGLLAAGRHAEAAAELHPGALASADEIYEVERLLSNALRLPTEARAELIGRLIDSMEEPADERVEAAWEAEIRHRIEAIDGGGLKPLPWSEARRQILL